jgi:2,4-dienoyl-CoA reductase-like NADH-dependent reductase (Old Yellow Enzyme family)
MVAAACPRRVTGHCEDTMQADPFARARLGPARLRNRVVKAATFEGMSPAGLVPLQA